MRVTINIFLLLVVGLLLGCRPSVDESVSHFESGVEYVLLTDPWSRYLSGAPKLYTVPKLTGSVRSLLSQEQALAKVILSGSGRVQELPEYRPLIDALEELKTAVPSAATRMTTSTRTVSSGSRSSAYASDDYSYARNGGGGSDGYSSVIGRVHRSSSPALARSVENIVGNATLQDLHQRIDALDALIESWTRKTEVMVVGGIDGAMRSANLEYLGSLNTYLKDFQRIYAEWTKVKARADDAAAQAEARLVEWQAFEGDGLVTLDRYVQGYATHVVAANSFGRYVLPAYEGVVLIGCQMGERTLYFNLSQVAGDPHPFRLVIVE
ncbi:hypothetical protein SH580_10815 [Coraliomargarita algicola]|uniref:Uncharacterized protein n=1 Tax=Coraliomargarita algicola TaxID=3092156 RepID=A0ABZ0RPP7_9BACT|nr:hypothetical protein [Coraliomargarita sp. J2-16]WPJ98190.1 hypothetical protein SH580_10815 [Coraliomargarita sp. J2-16]